jgi:probable HAF family extracellular repeat protein
MYTPILGMGGSFHPVIVKGTSVTDLGTAGTASASAAAINSAGEVVGVAHEFLNPGSLDGFVFDGLHPPYKPPFPVDAINDDGLYVGNSAGGPILENDNAGFYIEIGNFGGGFTVGLGISSRGQVVGFADMPGAGRHAWLYSDSQFADLNDLLDSSGAGWTVVRANDINSLGQIVGYGTSPSGQTDALLLTPVPEPSSVTLLGAAAIAAIYVCRLKRN